MPARQSARRRQRRQVRPLRQPQPQAAQTEAAQPSDDGSPAAAVPRQAPVSPTRLALQARAAELARLDVIYLSHDLRNIAVIAGLMLALVIGLSFVLR